jgi:predicted HTH domain antitoxin
MIVVGAMEADISSCLGQPGQEVLLELACGLYASRRLARGRASQLAGVSEDRFERELQSRGISNGYRTTDLDDDLSALNQLLAP